MNAAALAHPEWLDALSLALATGALALIAARVHARRRCRRLLGRIPGRRAHPLASDGALLAAGLAIAIAMLGPRFGEHVIRVPARGVDVVFLVDVSRSMSVPDVAPSRLDRARRAVEEILGRLAPGDRAGLAAFAERGLLLAPLTPDHAALVDLLAGLDTALIEPASSDLGAGVGAALAAFEDGSERPRMLVVASDGEDPHGARDLGAGAASDMQVRVVTIALGSEAGGFVPDGERPLRDRDGTPVRSRRQRDRLAQLATATDGAAFVGDAWGRIDFARAAAELRRDTGAPGEWIERRVAAARSAPFAALAFALLLLEALPRSRRAPRPGRSAAVGAGCVAAVLVAGSLGAETPGRAGHLEREAVRETHAAAEARVRAHPEDARARLELGLACLEVRRNDDAARAFQAATVFARSAPLAAVAYYDLGVAALAQGDLDAAREAFFAALDLDPSDEQARFNLEWTLRSASARRPEPDPIERARPGAADPQSGEGAEDARERVPAIPEMSEAQRRRWLERAEDDPRHWLRAAAGAPAESARRKAGPAW